MKKIDPQDRLQDGWEPTEIPDLRPDSPAPPKPRLAVLAPEAPTLCRQGPCVHYHELVTRLDAATPMDGSESATKKQRVRSCYPSNGIEIELEDTPVFECNLWLPMTGSQSLRTIEHARERHLVTEQGQRYMRELAEWKTEQERIAAEDLEYAQRPMPLTLIDEIAADMRDRDRLEVRRRGSNDATALLVHQHPISMNEDTIRRSCGDGSYQLRHIRPMDGAGEGSFAIVAVRNLDIKAPTPAITGPDQETTV